MLNKLFRRGAIKPLALLLGLVPVVGGGVLAYNVFFNRPGESAIKLIPDSALMVVTLDTTPSAEQVPTFTKILDAVKREGLEAKVDKAMTDAFDKSPLGAELRPELAKSFALAVLAKEDGVLMLAVKDPGKAAGILAKHTTKTSENGLDVYKMPKDGCAALISQYVVFSKTPAMLAQVEAVREGKASPLEKSADYQQARASLPKDANLMVFVSPAGLKEMSKDHSAPVNLSAMENTRYLTLGMTVRDSGLEIVGQVPTALPADSPLKALGQIAAVSPDALKRLPEGAYGVFAVSQPGKYWEPVSATATKPEQRQEMEKQVSEMETETGLSLKNDLFPALNGDLVVAVYPDQANPTKSVDIVALADDANGADPAAIADRLRTMLTKHNVKLQEEDRNGMKMVTAGEPIAGKSVCYTQAGHALIFASTPDLLEKAFRTCQVNGSPEGSTPFLLESPSYAAMQQAVVPGSQMELMIDLRKILETFKPQIEQALANEKDVKVDDVLQVFGPANSGLVTSGKFDGAAGTFQLRIPLDYERLVHMISLGVRKADEGALPMSPAQDHATEGTPSVVQ